MGNIWGRKIIDDAVNTLEMAIEKYGKLEEILIDRWAQFFQMIKMV